MSLSSLSLNYERELWSAGYDLVIGVDEVGRGALAGPVTVCAVAFPPAQKLSIPKDIFINDSKTLTPKRRRKAEPWIKQNVYKYSICSSPPKTVDRNGIILAIEKAMEGAMKNVLFACRQAVNPFILVDGARAWRCKILDKVKCEYKGVKSGDGKVFSIAAASIVAKVCRDKLMEDLSDDYPVYGWERNKGYGTREHRKAILNQGVTRHHRETFLRY